MNYCSRKSRDYIHGIVLRCLQRRCMFTNKLLVEVEWVSRCTLKSGHLHFLHRNLAYTAVWISVSKPHKVFFENMFQHCVVTVDEIWCIELYLNSLHVPQQTQKVSRKIFFIHLFCICTKEKYNNHCKNNNVKYMDSHLFEHRTNSNVFIYWGSNSNTLFLASNKRTSNIEPNY